MQEHKGNSAFQQLQSRLNSAKTSVGSSNLSTSEKLTLITEINAALISQDFSLKLRVLDDVNNALKNPGYLTDKGNPIFKGILDATGTSFEEIMAAAAVLPAAPSGTKRITTETRGRAEAIASSRNDTPEVSSPAQPSWFVIPEKLSYEQFRGIITGCVAHTVETIKLLGTDYVYENNGNGKQLLGRKTRDEFKFFDIQGAYNHYTKTGFEFVPLKVYRQIRNPGRGTVESGSTLICFYEPLSEEGLEKLTPVFEKALEAERKNRRGGNT